MIAYESTKPYAALHSGSVINRLSVNSPYTNTNNPSSKEISDVCNFLGQVHTELNQRGLVEEALLVHSHLQLLKTPVMLSVVSRWGLEPVLENLTNDFIVSYQSAPLR